MKAIVVRQPWATLIALGVKRIETRPGPPNGPMRPEGVRGLPGCTVERGERIAIVAGAGRTPWAQAEFAAKELLASGAWVRGDLGPFGVVVGTVVVDDALPIVDTIYQRPLPTPTLLGDPTAWDHGSVTLYSTPYDWEWTRPEEYPLGDYTPGRWGWLLDNVQQTDPIPCKGRQGVFQLPADVAERVAS